MVALVYHLLTQGGTTTGVYTSIVLSSCVLQREPVPLHRAFLSRLISGARSHENSMRPRLGMVAVRLPADFQEHNGHDCSRCGHGGL